MIYNLLSYFICINAILSNINRGRHRHTKIMEIAQNTDLIKRQRKFSPDTILKIFTFGLLNNADPSLKE